MMTNISCSMDKCIHNIDGHCNCNLIFIDNYGECEMYEEQEEEKALRECEEK